MTMGFAFAGEKPNMPGRHFRNPCVDAPRRVVGFDLAARAEKSGLPADSDENSNCKHPCSVRPTAYKSASSPRSALQQLLLPEIAIADPSSFLSADDGIIRVSCEPAASSDINNRKQARMLTPADRSQKSSLFILPATSLVAETRERCSQRQGADHQYKFKSRVMNMKFLDACHLCKRHLGEGRDLFMYSGDKAFCSTECRDHQIVTEKRMERCAPRIIRTGALAAFRGYMTSKTSNAGIKQSHATSSIKPISINKHNFINRATAA